MKGFLTVLLVCVVLAIIKAALAALVVTLAIALVVSFAIRPREMLVLLTTSLLLGLANARPTAFIVALGVVALTAVIVDAIRKPRRRLLLTDGRVRR